MSPREALASIRIVLCVAKADGRFAPEEETAIAQILKTLPEGTFGTENPTIESLLAEDINLELELSHLSNPEVQNRTYEAALLVAQADGNVDETEAVVLEKIKPIQGEDTLIGQIIGETKDTILPGNIPAIHDPEQRAVEIQEDRLKYSILSALLGANPLPGVAIISDIAVIGIQVKLVRDIGQYFGHTVDASAAKSLIGSTAGAVGVRLALSNLSKFIPGWGSVVGAVSSFATTWAIGKMAETWFESDCKLDTSALKATYEDAWKEGRRSYDAEKERIAKAEAIHKEALKRLGEDLQAGRITRELYEEKVAELGK
jgi:uncharacterized protein (DUF697 family)/uncharacterized tellurite resistance protein B-like protein